MEILISNHLWINLLTLMHVKPQQGRESSRPVSGDHMHIGGLHYFHTLIF